MTSFFYSSIFCTVGSYFLSLVVTLSINGRYFKAYLLVYLQRFNDKVDFSLVKHRNTCRFGSNCIIHFLSTSEEIFLFIINSSLVMLIYDTDMFSSY